MGKLQLSDKNREIPRKEKFMLSYKQNMLEWRLFSANLYFDNEGKFTKPNWAKLKLCILKTFRFPAAYQYI